MEKPKFNVGDIVYYVTTYDNSKRYCEIKRIDYKFGGKPCYYGCWVGSLEQLEAHKNCFTETHHIEGHLDWGYNHDDAFCLYKSGKQYNMTNEKAIKIIDSVLLKS